MIDMSAVGTDSGSAYTIVAKVEGYCNKQSDRRKVYVKGKTITWIVDSDRFSLCELNSDLSDRLDWGDKQTPKTWIIHKDDGTESLLESDRQILKMFKTYQKTKKIFIRVMICELEGSSNYSATAQPALDSESGSQNKEDNSNERLSRVMDRNAYGYVGLHDEYIYYSDVEDHDKKDSAKNAMEEVNFESDSIADFESDPVANLEYDPIISNSVHEEQSVEGTVSSNKILTHDLENPQIEVSALFPDVYAFRKALRHFSIKKEFEVDIIKTDKKRYIGKCRNSNCPWRIHASVVRETNVFKVKVLPYEHTCPSTTMVDGKMASKAWVSDRVTDWLKNNPEAGAKDVQNKLQDEFHVKVSYFKAWTGREDALSRIHGSWEGSFEMLYSYKRELQKSCPGSIVEIDVERVGNKTRFRRAFVALKPCIDGFLQGCRPYLAVDSTTLNGKYRGQFAAACSIDGHNWLYPVAYGAFDLENNENWEWFIIQLRRAIGAPSGLTISSDAVKGLEVAIPRVFPEAQHRECMWHLMQNFKKKFHGDVYEEDMYGASDAFLEQKCQEHLAKLPSTVIDYLKKNHNSIWCRSQFSELTKVDYTNNNLSESFNNWIKAYKGLHLVDLFDKIRELILGKFKVRRAVATKFKGRILPNVVKELHEISRKCGRPRILAGSDDYCEISGNGWRHVVELDTQRCSCREWRITGKPCAHAVAFICTIKDANLEDYVHEYYSVDRFKAAYAGRIPALTHKSLWEKVNLGFKLFPPGAKRPPGRPKKQRIIGYLEPGSRRQQCKRCKQFGHQQRTCKVGEEDTKTRKRTNTTQDGGSEHPPNSKRQKKRKSSITPNGASSTQDGASPIE